MENISIFVKITIIMTVTVDAVVFGYQDGQLKVLLVKRKYDPFKGEYALPGGFILDTETAHEAVTRELREETNVEPDYLEQLYTFTTPHRDPRGRVITIVYYALVNPNKFNVSANTDAEKAEWVDVSTITRKDSLAFDHFDILDYAKFRLKNKIKYEPIGFDLLPEKFTVLDLHKLYECVLDKKLDRPNFQNKIRKIGILEPTNEKTSITGFGPKTHIFKFNKEKYKKMKKDGFLFDI